MEVRTLMYNCGVRCGRGRGMNVASGVGSKQCMILNDI